MYCIHKTYADTSLPDLLERSSLNYADQASAICRPCLCYAVNEPPLYSTAYFKSWFLCVMKHLNNFFDVVPYEFY